MGSISLEVILILALVLLNGFFAMAEMAVVSSRKARLRQRAEEGSHGAAVALELAENPNDFLSTVQVGITLIGTLAGAFGGATIAEKLDVYLEQFPALALYSESIAIAIVVVVISYLSLILGELAPKSLALGNAEAIAGAIAPSMRWLAKLGSPLVRVLTFSTKLVMAILPVKVGSEAPVTEEEIKVLIAQGAEHGTFDRAEQEMVEGVFRLGDRRVVELMRLRSKVAWLDAASPWEENLQIIKDNHFSRYPVAEGDLDHLIGVAHVNDLFVALERNQAPDLRALARKPLFVPELIPALDLLERFQQSSEQIAFLVDEHGSIQGLVTLADLMDAVIGDLRGPGGDDRGAIVQREDGSWLADGMLPISDLLDELDLRELPGEEEGFTTLAGLILAHLHRIPSAGDYFELEDWRFEVVDMDGNRIDKVLITNVTRAAERPEA